MTAKDSEAFEAWLMSLSRIRPSEECLSWARNAHLAGVTHGAERAAHRELLALYLAVWTDECSATYCAGQRGGLVHLAAQQVHAVLGEPRALPTTEETS